MKNKVGRPSTGRIGWWSTPLWEREREQGSIMKSHAFEVEDFMNYLMVHVKPIDDNLYIATCINETLKLIDKRVEDRVFNRDFNAKQYSTFHTVHYESTEVVSDAYNHFDAEILSETILTESHRYYGNGYFNELAMVWYLRAKVAIELVKWLSGEIDRGKWKGKVNDEFPKNLDHSYQPFIKFVRTVINKREQDFKTSKLNLMTMDQTYKHPDQIGYR